MLDNRISKIYDDKLDGLISEETWKKKTNDWHAEKDGLTIKLQNLNTSSREFYEGSNLLLNFLKDAPRTFSEASPKKKKEILNFVGSNFPYIGEKVSIEPTLVFDHLLNNQFLEKSGDLETKLELFITNLRNLITVDFTRELKQLVA